MLYLQPSYEKNQQIITKCSLLYCDPRYIQNPIIYIKWSIWRQAAAAAAERWRQMKITEEDKDRRA